MSIRLIIQTPSTELSLPIFRLIIQQKEGEVALARLVVRSKDFFLAIGKKLLIAQEKKNGTNLIFSGRQLSFPKNITPELCEIELSSIPDDADSQLKAYSEKLKLSFPYDPLFYNEDNPADVLEGNTKLFHWDRLTGKLGLSDIFEGSETLDLSEKILKDSFQMRIGEMPYDCVEVSLSAQWVQKAFGEFNLYPFLESYFSKNKINTLTPESLENTWPRAGEFVGRRQGAYQVVESSLKRVMPNDGAFYPKVALVPQNKQGPPVILKRYWFEGKLVVAWAYQQKRKETVCFSINHNYQLKRGNLRKKKLTLPLQRLDESFDESNGTFFSTDRGVKAIKYALALGQAILAGRARCVEVDFQIPFEDGIFLTLDYSILLKLPFLYGKVLKGKIIHYQLIQTAKEKVCKLRLALSIGNKESRELQEAITQEDLNVNHSIVEGNANINTYTTRDFIESVHIKGDAEDQALKVKDSRLIEPTTITVTFKDLSPQYCLTNDITLNRKFIWESPKQMTLGEEGCG